MKILLTGYRGFIGSYMMSALRGHEVKLVEWGDDFPQTKGFDWAIHMGALSSTTETDIEKVLRQNLDYTIKLYDQCAKDGVNFQFSSSASVYGLGNSFNESAPVDPRTPYAWSKFLCERHILTNPAPITTQIFRYFNVYGPQGEEHKGTQASPFYQFRRQAIETGVISVFTNSSNYHRDFIHVGKIVDYHLKFMETKKSGVFNFGEGKTQAFMDVAVKTAIEYNAKIAFIDMPENLKHSYQKYTCADMAKTIKELA